MKFSLIHRVILGSGINKPRLTLFSRRFASTGLFKVDALNSPSGFDTLETQVYSECEILLKEVFSVSRSRKAVEILDDISNSICKLADLAECMRNLHPDKNYARAAEQSMGRLSMFVERLNTDPSLYNAVKKLANEGDETDRRVSQLFLTDFEASGVHLPESKRQSFLNTSQAIFWTGTEFTHGCEQPAVTKKASKSSFRTLLSLKSPEEQLEFLDHCGAYANSADERERLFKIFYQPIETQEDYLKRLIELRHSLAQTTGFESYAERALKNTILDNPNTVDQFLTGLIQKLKPKAENDLATLQSIMPTNRPVQVWDLSYLKAVHRQMELMEVFEHLINRFTIQSTLDGIRDVVQKLYNVKLERQEALTEEVWHEDVEKFVVSNESGDPIGTIYCDWFDRDGKTAADSHFTVRCSKFVPQINQYQLPIVVLTFRYPKSIIADRFGPGELSNILHEFGHAMHSILGRTKYQHVAGTRCPTDFSEIPSNLMELYLTDKRTIQQFGKGAPLVDSDTETITGALKRFSAIDNLQQTVYALFDLRLHSGLCNDTEKLFNDTCEETWPFLKVQGTCWHHRFSHLVPYGAKYHSYLVARASAQLIWRHLFQSDPLSATSGQKWANVQSYGGELAPNKILTDLLGEPVSPEKLCDALLS